MQYGLVGAEMCIRGCVTPTQPSVEVDVGPENRREGATKIGEKEMAQGRVPFDVPADVSGQYVVVWFTPLSTDGDGERRAWTHAVSSHHLTLPTSDLV